MGIKDWNDTAGKFHEAFAGKLVTLEAYYTVKLKSNLSFITFSPVYDVSINFQNGWFFFSIVRKEYGVLEGTSVVNVKEN